MDVILIKMLEFGRKIRKNTEKTLPISRSRFINFNQANVSLKLPVTSRDSYPEGLHTAAP
jgi:hypothetical protein